MKYNLMTFQIMIFAKYFRFTFYVLIWTLTQGFVSNSQLILPNTKLLEYECGEEVSEFHSKMQIEVAMNKVIDVGVATFPNYMPSYKVISLFHEHYSLQLWSMVNCNSLSRTGDKMLKRTMQTQAQCHTCLLTILSSLMTKCVPARRSGNYLAFDCNLRYSIYRDFENESCPALPS